MRVIELILVLVIVLVTNVNSRMVRNRIWVEARAPVISRHNGYRRHHTRPIAQAFTHMNLRISPTKMTDEHKKPTKQGFKAVRPHTIYTSNSFENDYDYQEYNDMKPVASVSGLNTREAENDEYSDDVCRGEPDRVRICEHCLKITRAPTAYEECCTDQDNAFSWCERIYNFSQSKGRR